MTDDWRKPYRSQDESGSPEAAGQVAHTWITEIAREEFNKGDRNLEMDYSSALEHPGINVLYRGTQPIAVTTVFRDPLNWAILIRWRAEQ